MKKRLFALSALIALLLVTSCASASYDESVAKEMPASAPMAMEEYVYEDSAADSGSTNINNSTTSAEVERIVLKNASLSIVVEDPAEAMEIIAKNAEESGGFIVNSNLYKTTTSQGVEIPEANITVRVPAETLLETIEEIKSLTDNPLTDVLRENVTGQDVTKEYTDLQSRLTNLENAAVKLEQIMDEAYKTEDVLAVYNELTEVSEQIEVIKGQIKYYDEASRLSSIDINIMAHEAYKPITIGGWEPVGVARKAVQALIDTMQFFVNAAIWFVIYLLPVLICMAIPIWLIVIGFKRIRKNRKEKKIQKEQNQLDETVEVKEEEKKG